MIKRHDVCVESEIGGLEGVILHTPGKEVENMTPGNVERALYSDILNLAVVTPEYSQLQGVLEKTTQTFFVRGLLGDILTNEKVKETLVHRICKNETVYDIFDDLLGLQPKELADQLLEGVVMKKDSLTRFLNKDYYALQPLHNFFYTRDAAIAMDHQVLISKMAGQVRERETIIMEAVFDSHPGFSTKTVTPAPVTGDSPDNITLEGGDVLVARDDVLLIGIGARTTPQGVDFIIDHFNKRKVKKHIVVQELPRSPESFIHLDMVFTFLDVDKCMAFEPIIFKPNRFQTVHITLDNGKVSSIEEEKNLPDVLKKLGFDLEPLFCGGSTDSWIQEREQWHSGANFFAVGPGKVIGYGRNVHTIEELNKHGFEVLDARKVIKGEINLEEHQKYVITIHGAELSRGGGGCRCMTMPFKRKPVQW
ncbi:MAG: arginine deiminase [bacterium]|nr:arginine deiminase [bacterium]